MIIVTKEVQNYIVEVVCSQLCCTCIVYASIRRLFRRIILLTRVHEEKCTFSLRRFLWNFYLKCRSMKNIMFVFMNLKWLKTWLVIIFKHVYVNFEQRTILIIISCPEYYTYDIIDFYENVNSFISPHFIQHYHPRKYS